MQRNTWSANQWECVWYEISTCVCVWNNYTYLSVCMSMCLKLLLVTWCGNPRKAFEPAIKSHVWKIWSTFDDKCPQNSSKYGSMAPCTGLGYPHEGPSVVTQSSRYSSSSSSLLLSSLELCDTRSIRLQYEPASEPLHISVKQYSRQVTRLNFILLHHWRVKLIPTRESRPKC